MRRGTEFAATIRGGSRSSGRYLVVHAHLDDDPTPASAARVGFVVSKAVGGAVRRNKVRRRLRGAMGDLVSGLPGQMRVVVRARPAAAEASFTQLDEEVRHLLGRATTRLRRFGAI